MGWAYVTLFFPLVELITHMNDSEGWREEGRLSRKFLTREGHGGKSLAFPSVSQVPEMELKKPETWKYQYVLTKEQPQEPSNGPGKMQPSWTELLDDNCSTTAKHQKKS